MMIEDRVLTFCIETRDNVPGIWLCIDDGTEITALAEFISETEVKRFLAAQNWYFRKAQAMALLGI